jgi:hypothetical protein
MASSSVSAGFKTDRESCTGLHVSMQHFERGDLPAKVAKHQNYLTICQNELKGTYGNLHH